MYISLTSSTPQIPSILLQRALTLQGYNNRTYKGYVIVARVIVLANIISVSQWYCCQDSTQNDIKVTKTYITKDT